MPADPLSITFRLRGMDRTKLCTTSPTLSVVIPSCGSNASNSLRRWLARALLDHHRRSQCFLVLRADPFPLHSNLCRRSSAERPVGMREVVRDDLGGRRDLTIKH